MIPLTRSLILGNRQRLSLVGTVSSSAFQKICWVEYSTDQAVLLTKAQKSLRRNISTSMEAPSIRTREFVKSEGKSGEEYTEIR